jgi:hypothetical protein
VTAALATTLTGCSSESNEVEDAEYAKICRDETTEERLPDEECEEPVGNSHMHAGWFFLPRLPGGGRTNVPAVGTPVEADSGTTSVPAGTKTQTAPRTGGNITRGGVGSTGGGAGNPGDSGSSGHGHSMGGQGTPAERITCTPREGWEEIIRSQGVTCPHSVRDSGSDSGSDSGPDVGTGVEALEVQTENLHKMALEAARFLTDEQWKPGSRWYRYEDLYGRERDGGAWEQWNFLFEWDARLEELLDMDDQPNQIIFKLCPWEEMMGEEFGSLPATQRPTGWIEAAWKMFLSTKVPGAGMWQQYTQIPNFPGPDDGAPNHPVPGGWVVNGESVGVGIRESDGPVTDYRFRFVPDLIHG